MLARLLDECATAYHAIVRQFTGALPRYEFTWSERFAALVLTLALAALVGVFVW